ncbi:helix-turn-helix domain-containing protein [Pediococcus siamensis]|uniref:helix-turn-helix domain-containing protein n=1 Tax=Pediococcus siamensis TaxID=381829 RepID=UPI0039A0C75F
MDKEEIRENEEAIKVQVAKELVQFRLRNGFTQTQLAERAGKRQSQIARMESGRANVSFKTLDEIVSRAGGKIAIRIED